MKITRFLLSCFVAYFIVSSSQLACSADEGVSFSSLLQEMVDRETLARYPSPAYTCKQFSSYDRDSDDPQDESTWFANWDRSQYLRTEEKDGRKEYVMMDADGPGAIVRVWSTWHGPRGEEFSNGTLRIYIDGNEKPAIEGKITDIIDGGQLAGAPLSQGVSPETDYRRRGHNLYLPIPYAKHCKVTYSTDVLMDQGGKQGEALYYQINYRTYESGTEVESFSMDVLEAEKSTLEEVQNKLAEGHRSQNDSWKSSNWNGELAPDEEKTALEMDGPGAIRELRFKISADNLSQALRSTILEVTFDGNQTVWAPLGDFFGTGYKLSPYQSWYTAVTEEGELSCVWVMPFENSASVVLKNVGDQTVTVDVASARTSDWKWDDRSMHFHATWHQLTDVDTGGNPDEKREMDGHHARDVNYVTVEGKGVYVGDTLTLFNGAASWWGEGDEKIYVDGEDFPSHIGTGTEDYYGYAWCLPAKFEAPFHAQPEGDGNLTGGFSVNSRYRALDAIPFESGIKFDMELWHWAHTRVDYAPTSLFYARPGAEANIEPDPETAARPVTLEKNDET